MSETHEGAPSIDKLRNVWRLAESLAFAAPEMRNHWIDALVNAMNADDVEMFEGEPKEEWRKALDAGDEAAFQKATMAANMTALAQESLAIDSKDLLDVVRRHRDLLQAQLDDAAAREIRDARQMSLVRAGQQTAWAKAAEHAEEAARLRVERDEANRQRDEAREAARDYRDAEKIRHDAMTIIGNDIGKALGWREGYAQTLGIVKSVDALVRSYAESREMIAELRATLVDTLTAPGTSSAARFRKTVADVVAAALAWSEGPFTGAGQTEPVLTDAVRRYKDECATWDVGVLDVAALPLDDQEKAAVVDLARAALDLYDDTRSRAASVPAYEDGKGTQYRYVEAHLYAAMHETARRIRMAGIKV